MVSGIINIPPIKTRDAFAAAKICKNGPYLIFDEWVKSCFSKFADVIAGVSMVRKVPLVVILGETGTWWLLLK